MELKTRLDEIIKYLADGYKADSSLIKKPTGHYAYELGLTPSTEPYFELQALSSSDNTEDFCEVATTTVNIQINVYGVKTKVNNSSVTAQEHAMILADKCETIMNNYKYSNDSITEMRKSMRSPTMPYYDGAKAYTTALRYQIVFNNY